MKRLIITIVVILAAGALIAWVLTNNKKENEAKTAVVAQTDATVVVTAIEVEKMPVNLDFSTNGNFTANQDLRLMAEASGRITSLLVDEGARVSKGQVLARIDAEYASLDVQRIEDALNKLKTDYSRYQSSYETGGVTKAQLDEIELALSNTENQLQQAKRRLQDADVKAPISGVINKRQVEVGAYVNPGTELFEIVDVSKLKLQVTVNESQVVHIKQGDRIGITSTVFPGEQFSGQIRFIAVKADNTLSYPVEIEVNNPDVAGLKAGMYATAHFKYPEQAPAIVVPRSAFLGSVSSNQVYVMTADSSAVLRQVVPGQVIGEQVVILEGLEEGEILITSGQINLNQGVKVDAQIK